MIKKILKISLLTALIVIGITILLLALDNEKQASEITNAPQNIVPVKQYNKEEDKLKYDSLFNLYGKNKKLPCGFELQSLIALSHYPQLRNTNIEFRFTDSKGSLYSQMDVDALLNPWKDRKYVVIIDTVKIIEYTEPTLLENLPYNAQIGVLGHELAHTVSYLDKNGLQLAWIAFRYQTSEKYVVPFENDTERRTIKFGLGYQLLAWSEFQYDIKIKEGKSKRYFSPNQIKEEMKKYAFY